MNKDYQNEPALPTIPIQDQFGRTIFFTGLTKLELVAAIVASGYINSQKNGSILFPEVIAAESIELAKNILKYGEENRNTNDNKLISE